MTKIGTEKVKSSDMRISKSNRLFACTAAITPAGSPMAVETNSVIIASSIETGICCIRSAVTVRPVMGEVPKSPCNA